MLFFAIEEAMRARLVRNLKRSMVQSQGESEVEKAANTMFVVSDYDAAYSRDLAKAR